MDRTTPRLFRGTFMRKPWSTPIEVLVAKELPYLSRIEVAEFLRLDESTLRAWATRSRGPRFLKLGSARCAPVLYPREEVTAFLADPLGYEARNCREEAS